jgi:P27 family predicted phage terminase small subunit
MGRPAKSKKLHEMFGTHSEAVLPEESKVPAGQPKCPKALSAAARKKFKELCKELAARRVLTPGDGELLSLYAELYDRRARCMVAVRAEGEVIQYESRGKNGDVLVREKKNLNLVIAQESEKQMVGILVQLGLSPLQKDKVKQAPHPAGTHYERDSIGWMLLNEENKNAEHE